MNVFFFSSISGGSGSDVTLSPMREKVTDEYTFLSLDQLEIVATLGMGGFGRVELVRINMKFAIFFFETQDKIITSNC